jgi:hypothetical protein
MVAEFELTLDDVTAEMTGGVESLAAGLTIEEVV